MSKLEDAKNKPLKCPNPMKGDTCPVCGGTYICLEPWRKKRTYKKRVIAQEAERKRK